MGAIAAYLDQLDQAWSHRFESLADVLDGVGDEEAAWQAPCYRTEEREEGWPPPGSILWQIAHVAHCKRYYAALIRARGDGTNPPVEPRRPLATLAEERAALDAVHADQRAAIAELADEELDVPVGNGTSLREFLPMIVRHDAWHASQIAVARRLWRTRD